ncbi:MAG: hypothetical protein WCQ44_01230, partial [Opitutaceae bacterium]
MDREWLAARRHLQFKPRLVGRGRRLDAHFHGSRRRNPTLHSKVERAEEFPICVCHLNTRLGAVGQVLSGKNLAARAENAASDMHGCVPQRRDDVVHELEAPHHHLRPAARWNVA